VRSVSIIIAALAALVTAVVAFRHFEGVRHLREAYGVTQFPLLSPALLVPSGGIALAAWLLRLGRNGYAAVASAASLLIAGLFFSRAVCWRDRRPLRLSHISEGSVRFPTIADLRANVRFPPIPDIRRVSAFDPLRTLGAEPRMSRCRRCQFIFMMMTPRQSWDC
jgi:hypothetical protein